MTILDRPAVDIEPLDRDCPECAGRLRANDTEIYCDRCGVVVAEDHLDRGPYWRLFDAKDRKHHKRTHHRTHDNGLGRTGRKPSRTWEARRTHDNRKSRNLAYLLTRVGTICAGLECARTTRDRALSIVREIHTDQGWEGNDLDVLAAVAVLAACRDHRVPVLVDEVSEAAGLDDTRRLPRAYTRVCAEVGVPYTPADPRWFVTRFAADLGLSPVVIDLVRDIVDRTVETGVANGKAPTTLIAGAIDTVTLHGNRDGGVTQDEIAAACHASGVSVRNIRDAIEEGIDDLPEPVRRDHG